MSGYEGHTPEALARELRRVGQGTVTVGSFATFNAAADTIESLLTRVEALETGLGIIADGRPSDGIAGTATVTVPPGWKAGPVTWRAILSQREMRDLARHLLNNGNGEETQGVRE